MNREHLQRAIDTLSGIASPSAGVLSIEQAGALTMLIDSLSGGAVSDAVRLADEYAAKRDWNGAYNAMKIALNAALAQPSTRALDRLSGGETASPRDAKHADGCQFSHSPTWLCDCPRPAFSQPIARANVDREAIRGLVAGAGETHAGIEAATDAILAMIKAAGGQDR